MTSNPPQSGRTGAAREPEARRWRVALAGYYGFGNLGDELLAEAAIASLLRRGISRSDIVMLSSAPLESSQKFGVEAVNRWSVPQVCRTLRRSETLLLGGGGLFQDATSLRSCFYYWGLVRAARRFGAVPWALGQSVGPLTSRAGRVLTVDALSRCLAVQVRDAASESLCKSLGLSVETGEDLVLSLGDIFASAPDAEKAPARLLVNLRPHELAGGFASAAANYAASFGGETVGVALSDEDERLLTHFSGQGRLPLSGVIRIASLPDAISAFRGGTAAVGMRLHFVILAAMAGILLAAAPYDPKVESFAAARDIPMWKGGALPSPLRANLPSGLSLRARESVDALCRKVLS